MMPTVMFCRRAIRTAVQSETLRLSAATALCASDDVVVTGSDSAHIAVWSTDERAPLIISRPVAVCALIHEANADNAITDVCIRGDGDGDGATVFAACDCGRVHVVRVSGGSEFLLSEVTTSPVHASIVSCVRLVSVDTAGSVLVSGGFDCRIIRRRLDAAFAVVDRAQTNTSAVGASAMTNPPFVYAIAVVNAHVVAAALGNGDVMFVADSNAVCSLHDVHRSAVIDVRCGRVEERRGRIGMIVVTAGNDRRIVVTHVALSVRTMTVEACERVHEYAHAAKVNEIVFDRDQTIRVADMSGVGEFVPRKRVRFI